MGPTAAVLVFFFVCILIENVFVAEETSDLHIKELLKYHKYFPILVLEGSLSIEIIIISKGYHYVINLSILAIFYISIDRIYEEGRIQIP